MAGTYYNEIDPFCCDWLQNLMDEGAIPHGEIDRRDIRTIKPSTLADFTQCHFFAGVSGWPAGLRLAGWPDDRPVFTGSTPCQPFSSAGKRKGEKDERHLWPAFRDLIAAVKPQTVFGEQVASSEVVGTQLEASFLVAVQNGDFARANKLAKRLVKSKSFHYWPRWIDRVQADLATEGYAVGFKVLGAHSVGSPHIRQRLWWVAQSNIAELQGQPSARQQPQYEQDGGTMRLADAKSQHNRAGSTRSPRRVEPTDSEPVDRLGDTNGRQLPQPQEQSAWQEQPTASGTSWSDFYIVQCADGKQRRVGRGIFPLASGLPRSVGQVQSRISRVDHLAEARRSLKRAKANRVGRLKGYGNAICPQVAAEFIRACMRKETP